MNIKIAALIGAAGAILGANSAAASEIVNDQGLAGSMQIASYGPVGQSFVAADPWLTSIAFFYSYADPAALSDPIQMNLYDGGGTGGKLIASRIFRPTTTGFFGTDFTGTGLTVGASYTAAVTTTMRRYSAYFTSNRYQGGQIQTPINLGSVLGKDASFFDLMFRIDGTTVAPVPEPATWALMLVGFVLVGAAMRRRSAVRVAYA